MAGIQCIGCDTPIPYGATKCPMCYAPVASTEIKQPSYKTPMPSDTPHQEFILQKTCKHCLKQIPDSVIICAHCCQRVGYSMLEKIGGGFMLFVFLLILILALLPPTQHELDIKAAAAIEDQERSEKYDAKERALYLVKSTLKSPSSAVFGEPYVIKTANTFEVGGYVDSQNSFGAMLRTTFTVVLSKNGDQWKLVDFKI